MPEGGPEVKPSEFYVGVIDLFAVLLPGAVVAFVLRALLYWLPEDSVFRDLTALDSTAGGFAFLLAAYLLGHILFSLSSRLDQLYDAARGPRGKDPLYEGVARLRKKLEDRIEEALPGLGKPAERGPGAAGAWWVSALSVLLVRSWREEPPRDGDHAMNTFKTAMAFLQLRHPASLVEVRRLEADSKFFRSVVLVAAFLGIGLAVQVVARLGRGPVFVEAVSVVVLVLLARLSFARYCEQRKKAVELAYQLALVAVATQERGPEDTEGPIPQSD